MSLQAQELFRERHYSAKVFFNERLSGTPAGCLLRLILRSHVVAYSKAVLCSRPQLSMLACPVLPHPLALTDDHTSSLPTRCKELQPPCVAPPALPVSSFRLSSAAALAGGMLASATPGPLWVLGVLRRLPSLLAALGIPS